MHGNKAKEARIGDEGIITSNGQKFRESYLKNPQTKALCFMQCFIYMNSIAR